MASQEGESSAAAEGHELEKLPLKLELMKDYMDEQYAAARHHQTLRVPTLALLASAAVILFTRALEATPCTGRDTLAGWYIGWAVIGLGAFAFIANLVFHRANRLHSETATNCRKVIARYVEKPERLPELRSYPADPVWVRNAVKKHMGMRANPEFEKVLSAGLERGTDPESKGLKIGEKLSLTFHLVPILVLLAGAVLLRMNYAALSAPHSNEAPATMRCAASAS